MKHGSEAVGFNNKVSPYYDVDIPIPFDTQKEEIRRLKEEKDDECFKIIVAIWSDYKDKIRIKSNVKEVRIIKKQGKKYYKISLRYYVKGVMMKNKNILKHLNKHGITENNKPFDLSVYNDGRILMLPYTSKPKSDDDDSETVLYPVIKNDGTEFNVFDYCATYVDKNDIDLDELFLDDDTSNKSAVKASEEPKLAFERLEHDDDDDCIQDDTLINEIISHISPKRMTDYNGWLYICWALINVLEKKGYSKVKIRGKIHELSSKGSNYDEDEVDKKFDNNIQNREKKYGWTYLIHTCIKEDAPEYYEQFNKIYYNVKKNFEKKVFKCYDPICFIELNLEQDELNQKPYYIYSEKECTNCLVEFLYLHSYIILSVRYGVVE
jgi:hypothetical protein